MRVVLIFLVVAILALSFVLSRATDVLVGGIKQLARGTAFESFGLTTFLVALATSLPELFVAVAAALEGEATFSVGVVVGSNITNVSLVVGGAALISGVLKVRKDVHKKEVINAFVISCLPLLLLLDKELNRLDGIVLLAVYAVFVAMILGSKQKESVERLGEDYVEAESMSHRILVVLGKRDTERGLMRLMIGSALMIVCADLMVKLSELVAGMLNVPMILVGMFMVSVGANLPDLTFGIRAIKKREYLMVFGNLVGALVAKSTLVLGTVALLTPISLGQEAQAYYVSVIALVIIFGVFWGLTWSKKRLERWEGALLVVIYLVFAAIQMGLV